MAPPASPSSQSSEPASAKASSAFQATIAKSSLVRPLGSNNHEDNAMLQNRGAIARNFLSKDTRNVPAFSITHGDWLKRVSQAMREDVGDRPGAAKELASRLECSEKTAQSWLDGRTAPAGILDLRAMNRVPAYAALKRQIAAMEMDCDPRVQAKLMELYRLTLALAGPV